MARRFAFICAAPVSINHYHHFRKETENMAWTRWNAFWKRVAEGPEPVPHLITHDLVHSGASIIISDGLTDKLGRQYAQVTMKRKQVEPDERVWRFQFKTQTRDLVSFSLTELKRVTGADELARDEASPYRHNQSPKEGD
jgi:hypothetical protein